MRLLRNVPSLCAARLLAAMWVAVAVAPGAQAEKADRSKSMVVEADKPGTVDLQRRVVDFSGNVVITQGTMLIRAERVELRERPDGSRLAVASGSSAKPATFRQKRDGLDEYVEGAATRIEFDTQTEVLRLSGQSTVKRLRGSVVADEISGETIVWNDARDLFSVEGAPATPGNPSGRVRAVIAPRTEAAAANPAPSAQAAPSATPTAPAAPRAAPAPSRSSGERR